MAHDNTTPTDEALRTAERALEDYDDWVATTPDEGRRLKALIIDTLDDAGLVYDQVAVRIKDRDSFRAKINNPEYPNYSTFEEAHDLIGLRVITYHSSDIPQLVELLSDLFSIERILDKAAETARAGRFGYASKHLIARYGGHLIEIQLRTVLQHAWAEFEHDIRYKNGEELPPEINRAFTLAAGLIELADQQFDLITDYLERPNTPPDSAAQIDQATLGRELARLVGDSYPSSPSDYYAYAVAMLEAHGFSTYPQLAELLSPEHLEALKEAMDYPYRPGQVRLVDDMLLFIYGRQHIRKTVHIGENTATRPGRLGNRWQKLDQKTLSERTSEV